MAAFLRWGGTSGKVLFDGRFRRWTMFLAGWLICCGGVHWPQTHAQQVATSRVNDTFPVVIRVSQQVFHSPEPEVHETNPIDMVVLGTRAVGQGETVAQVFPDFQRSISGAAFDLVFQGEVRAHTVGRRSPAVISTQTWSAFELRAPIRLDRENGFTAASIQSHVRITRQCRTISSTLPGLRGRIVRRVAAQRVASQEILLQQITEDTTRQRLEAEFRAKLDQRLARWNRWFTTIQTSLRQQPWFEQVPELALGTDENHLLIGVDFEGRDRDSQPLLPELPAVTADDEAYPLDIFLGPKLFDSIFEQATVAGTVAMVSGMLTERREAAAETRISAPVERLNVVVGQAGPWTVIQVRRDPQSP